MKKFISCVCCAFTAILDAKDDHTKLKCPLCEAASSGGLPCDYNGKTDVFEIIDEGEFRQEAEL